MCSAIIHRAACARNGFIYGREECWLDLMAVLWKILMIFNFHVEKLEPRDLARGTKHRGSRVR